jgi:hypothetical protein
MASSDFNVPIEQIALKVLSEFVGEPNRALSSRTELRWGKGGSLSVDLVKNTWHDHEDQTGGGVLDLLQSFRGYSKAEAIEWLQDEGYLERRDRPQPNGQHAGPNGASPQGKFAGFMDDHPVAVFEYFDDKGKLAYEVLKFAKTAPRRYMQRRPHPSGKGWIWGLQGGLYGRVRSGDWFKAKAGKHYEAEEDILEAVRWLYRRDEVLKAKAEGKPVVLVEGEKDVETLRAWGVVATTNAGGAKYWTPGFDEDLAGADVVICGDNDDSSRQRTLMRGAGLKGRAKSVRVLDLALHWKDCPEKSDVSDWRDQAGGTAEAFGKLLKKAPLWQPQAPKSRYGAMRWSQMDDPGPELEYLIDGLLTQGERSVVAGPSRSGKSFLAIHMALCVARGVPFFGRGVERGGVVYQAGEGARGVRKRMRAYRKHFAVPPEEDVPFILLQSAVDLYRPDGDTSPLIEEIKAQAVCMPVPLRLVVVDTLATATAGADENSGKDMGVVLANIARIAKECGCHVMLVHHMNAAGKKVRGHTSIFGNVDQVIEVTWDEEKSKVRTATLTKQKDDEDGLRFPFRLHAVEVGHDKIRDRPVTSCVVITVDESEQLQATKERIGFSPNPTERKILMNLFDAIDRHGKYVATEADGPKAATGRSVVDWNTFRDVALEKMPEIEDRRRAAEQIRREFARAKDFLIKAGVVGVQHPFMWWAGKPVRGFARTSPNFGQTAANAGTNGSISDAGPISPGLAEVMASGGEILF